MADSQNARTPHAFLIPPPQAILGARAAAHLQDNQRPVHTSDSTVLEAGLQSVVAGRSGGLDPRHVSWAIFVAAVSHVRWRSARAGCEGSSGRSIRKARSTKCAQH